MNTIAMVPQQSQQASYPDRASIRGETGAASLFQQLLETRSYPASSDDTGANDPTTTDKQVLMNILQERIDDKAIASDTREQLEQLKEMLAAAGSDPNQEIPDELDVLLKMMVEQAEELGLMPATATGPGMENIIGLMLNPVEQDAFIAQLRASIDGTDITSKEQIPLMEQWKGMRSNGQSEPVQLTEDQKSHIQQQMLAIAKQAQSIIAQGANDKDMLKAARSILTLLEQWTNHAKELPDQKNRMDTLMPEKHAEGNKVQVAWRELVQFYQKRNQFVANQQYQMNAKVSSQEVAKVLQNIQNQLQSEKQTTFQEVALPSMPMTKVEQYVIHLQANANAEPIDQQLINQLQKVMKSSRFLTLPNGNSQLTISLKPDNLGDIQLKVIQMDGEMTVRIIVATQAAKDMLESNLHQLKHMFSPQQVVIEKQDMPQQAAQGFQEKQENQQSMHDQGQQQEQGQSNQDKTSQQTTGDEDVPFHELLMKQKGAEVEQAHPVTRSIKI
ncbi:flagellar hook-length control protein FliK [Lentibacillus sp. N15]|uniref:flagellar hook-length control protein FliK n=1 Tax=Lentibacillus songyuanensis TaxID=3136161 RepID=UPI0031B9C969